MEPTINQTLQQAINAHQEGKLEEAEKLYKKILDTEPKNLDANKRPISAVADNFEVRNVKVIKVGIKSKITFKLLYDRDKSLQKKIKLEQIRREFS